MAGRDLGGEEKRLRPRYDKYNPFQRPWFLRGKLLKSKVVFLDSKNLEKLRGYKVFVEVDPDHGEVKIIITGLLSRSKDLFDSLLEMSKEEAYGK